MGPSMDVVSGMFSACRTTVQRLLSAAGLGVLTAISSSVFLPLCQAQTSEDFVSITNIVQLRQAAAQHPPVNHSIQIEGTVWWVRTAQGRWVLSDSTGAEVIQLSIPAPALKPGQRIRIEGKGTVIRRAETVQIGAVGAIVDNDGEHALTEKSGAVHLEAGLNPIRLEWFNGIEGFGLEVEYESPQVPRQRIPSSALFHAPAAGGETEVGLAYRCYEGGWELLPEFEALTPVQSGIVSNFDLSVVSRAEHAALVFTGQLKVPAAGLHTFHVRSDDGARLFVGRPSLSVEVIGERELPEPERVAVGQTWLGGEGGRWVAVEGSVVRVHEGPGATVLELGGGLAGVRVEVGDGPHESALSFLNRRVRVVGFCLPAITLEGERVVSTVLTPDFDHIDLAHPPEGDGLAETDGLRDSELTLLRTAAEVHGLKREDAERGYPVRVSGVVTSVLPEHQAFTIQDATRGLYVEDLSEYRSHPPQVGEFLAVEGVTDPSLFAPIVNARLVTSLGRGQMPDPVQPTWDQLMNGSLDAQFVQMQGIVTAVESNAINLLTRDGVINVELRVADMGLEGLASFENALVRIRGCLFASWDYLTHQVQMGEVRIYDADLIIDQPPPEDLFASPAKTAAELLLFDPMAGAFQRVKVTGQIVHVRGNEHFMMDGKQGLRFLSMVPESFDVGDRVEVVGFPELFGGASPVLREAVVRKIGHGELPEAKALSSEALVDAANDCTLVSVQGTLTGVRRTGSGQVLELQSGVRSFAARLMDGDDFVESLPAGTRLELRGVYVGQGGVEVARGEIAGFDLLLNAASDIRILAKPPWWTLKRLLVVVGALVCVLAATMLWVSQLRTQVEQRSTELAAQIEEREHVEHQRAIEQERARIAQDLHDELGSGITEISMLAARARLASASGEKRTDYLTQAWARAREMVTSLDEIVWAMDPHHDSLSSLVSYLSLYADRFLGLADIAWRLDGPVGPEHHVLNSRHRYQLFLAFKEALNNIVRHAGATEVQLRIQAEASDVRLTVTDNGSGLPKGARTDEMSGVANMRARIERLGGSFELSSETGKGTTVRFVMPTNKKP